MSIRADIQSLGTSALIELFVLDTSELPGGSIQRFHAGTNGLLQPITWQEEVYQPLPITAEGFDVTAKGATPRPKMTVANVNGIFSAEVKQFNDFVGCKLTRKRTFAKYLDGVNFPDGENPTADPNQHFPDDIWFVERKMSETRHVIQFELASAFDLQGTKLPGRQIIKNSCPWVYRSTECGWEGGYYDMNNNPVGDASQDRCAKTLSACKARFQVYPLRFGGFPGAVRGSAG